MERRNTLVGALAGALVVLLAAAPVPAADDTLRGTLVSVDDDGKSFTIQTSEGKRHVFGTPAAMDLEGIEPGTEVQVTAEPITAVQGEERRRATALAVLPADDAREGDRSGEDPARGAAPSGGPPSGGIPGGGVPSGGAPGGGIPSGGGAP